MACAVCRATDEEFALIFPDGQDIAFIDEVYERGVDEAALNSAFEALWMRRVVKPKLWEYTASSSKSRSIPPVAKEPKLQVKRIVANFKALDLDRARAFYQDVLGLELLMDHGWIQTYGSQAKMSIQMSFATEGGSGAPVPDISIEVDDVDTACARMKGAGFPIEYGPADEPWGVRRFFVRDPFGKLINVLAHT